LVAFAFVLFRGATRDDVANRRAADDAQFLWMLVLSGIALRAALTLVLRSMTTADGHGMNDVIAPDEFTYHDNGLYFAAWVRGEPWAPHPFAPRWLGSTQVGYFAFVGAIYAAFGEYPVLPVLVNCIVGGLCAIPAYRIAARVAGRSAGRG